jgi:secreted PhoX family phosphatase
MSKDEKKSVDASRRSFLRGSAVAGAGAVLTAAVPTTVIAAPEAEVEEGNKGYQLTQHVTDYYKSVAS